MSSKCDFSKSGSIISDYHAPILTYYDHGSIFNEGYSEFLKIKKKFRILQVGKINNPLLYGIYLLHKEEARINYGSVTERMLYHVTSPDYINSIIQNNLNWRMTKRARFGQGVCFADCPQYAHRYAGSCGVMVVAQVITNNIEETSICYDREVPTYEQYDTTSKETVFVKYDDYTFYPKFVVYYTRK